MTKTEKCTTYVYILKCADGTLYTGWTTSLDKRVGMHNRGKGSKYTRSRLPVELLYREECDSKEEALKREREIKAFSRTVKMELCGLTELMGKKRKQSSCDDSGDLTGLMRMTIPK